MVKALLLDKKNQSPAPTPSTTPAPVKVVELSCVSCGGAHSYQNCPVTQENAYRDNIQNYVSQAAAANYNQGNTDFRPQMVANRIRPPGFSPHQNNQNNFNRGNNFNQNRGRNFNQSNPASFNQGQLHRPQVNQALVYQAPIPQTQRVSQLDFESYVKANDTILRNIQSQGQSTQSQCQNIQNQNQNLQNQMATLTEMMSKLISANTAPSSGSGTLPANTVTNPKEDLKANEKIEKFYEIFKEMRFEISFTDALILMPKFASTLKALIGNKEKLMRWLERR
nr:reverse transcriptase domain-containing protein [Tanacetum cinerariifolium]